MLVKSLIDLRTGKPNRVALCCWCHKRLQLTEPEGTFQHYAKHRCKRCGGLIYKHRWSGKGAVAEALA